MVTKAKVGSFGSIGDGAAIGSNADITKIVPPFAVVGRAFKVVKY